MPISFQEGVLLQGYLQYDAASLYDQTIITQGYGGRTVPVSAILLFLPEILISSAEGSLADYFPQWMDVHYLTDPVTGSLLRRFLRPPKELFLSSAYYANKVENQRFFSNWLGEVSRGWYVSTDILSEQVKSVVITTPAATIYPVRCASEWEFVTSIGPAYIVDDSSYTIYFRGLDKNVIKFNAFGYVPLLSGEVMAGSDIYWKDDLTGRWTIVEAGSSNLQRLAQDRIITNFTGTTVVIYPSTTMYNASLSAVVSVNTGPSVPLEYMDYWNSFDEVGLLVDISRIPAEDNESYWKRLKTSFPFLGSSTEDGLKQAIGRKLDTLGSGYWNGIASLTWGASSGVLDVWVHQLPELSYSIQEAMREQNLTYFTRKRVIGQTYIFHDNILLGVTPVSGRISVSTVYDNGLLASYKYSNFTLISSGGSIAYLNRTENTPEDIYEVAWNRGLLVNTMNKKSYRNQYLLDGDGKPTTLFLELADEIRRKVEVTLGFTRWEKAHFFSTDEISPQLDYLPIPYDSEED